MNKIYLVIIILLMIGCSLEHSNPFDSSNVEVPAIVVNITLSVENQPNPIVKIEWDRISNVDGYYIYRALTYNGKYNKIATVENVDESETLLFNDDNIQNNQSYFYKLSSFKKYDDVAFEGSLSGYKQIWVE